MTRQDYESVIGLEVHVQLRTTSKMFCACRADYQESLPNELVCPVCLGLPGALPVINKKAVEYTVTTGIALNCQISSTTKFDRKNYAYPDLMKGYQISQFDAPIASDGFLEVEIDGSTKPIGIERVHLEEDVAKLQHVPDPESGDYSLVDINRSGVPLMEIVGHPDIRSPEEARRYLTAMRSILQYIGVTTGNMEEGSFRCDANISIRPVGSQEFMTRVEIKNLNSFRSVYDSLTYELERQSILVESGGRVLQETRGWLENRGITVAQRTKEYAHDYRYFPEPDLPHLVIDDEWVNEIRTNLPELPTIRRDRLIAQYGLSVYDANMLTASKDLCDFFEGSMMLDFGDYNLKHMAKVVANFLLGEVARLVNSTGKNITQSKLIPAHMVELSGLVSEGTLNASVAKLVLEEAFNTGKSPSKIVNDRGYLQISDELSIDKYIIEAIDQNPKAVADYISGKETALKFVVGQVMRLTKGQANPGMVNDLVQKKLEAIKTA